MKKDDALTPSAFIGSVLSFSVSTWVNALLIGFATILCGYLIDPAVFGLYELMISASTTMMSLISLGLDHAYIRFYHTPPEGIADHRELAASCMIPAFLALALCSFLFLFVAPNQVGNLLFGIPGIFLIAAMCLNTFFQLTIRFFNLTYRLQNRVALFTLQAILLQFFTRAFYLIGAAFRPDLTTIVSFNIGGLFVFTLVFFLIQKKDVLPPRIRLSKKSLAPLLSYGVGLAPSGILLFGNQLFTRAYLRAQAGDAASGIFSYAVMLSNILSIAQAGFANFWSAFVFKHYQNDRRRIAAVHEYIMLLLLLAMAGLVLVTPVGFWILSEKYAACRPLFGPILLSPLFLIVSETTVYGVEIAKKTYFHTIGISLSFLLNVVASILLVPTYGLPGAVFAYILSFAAMFLIRTLFAQPFYRTIEKPWKTALSLTLITLLALGSYLLDQRRLPLSLLSVALLIYAFLAYRPECIRLFTLIKDMVTALLKARQRS